MALGDKVFDLSREGVYLMRRLSLLAVAATVAAVLAGCGSITVNSGRSSSSASPSVTASPTPPPSPMPSATGTPNGLGATREGLTIQVMGSCSDPQGMRLFARGFTVGGVYVEEVHYPDRQLYTYLANGGVGHVGPNGDAPDWTWDCYTVDRGQHDPAGTYSLKMTDKATGHYVTTTFTVSYN